MMYKQCRTEQSSNRQRILEQGLLDAMIQQHYDSISVSDLCSRMGIPRKSFYRYFSGKEGALHALIDHALLDYENYPYDDPTWETFDGEVMAAVRTTNEKGTIRVIFSADGCEDAEVSIESR